MVPLLFCCNLDGRKGAENRSDPTGTPIGIITRTYVYSTSKYSDPSGLRKWSLVARPAGLSRSSTNLYYALRRNQKVWDVQTRGRTYSTGLQLKFGEREEVSFTCLLPPSPTPLKRPPYIG